MPPGAGGNRSSGLYTAIPSSLSVWREHVPFITRALMLPALTMVLHISRMATSFSAWCLYAETLTAYGMKSLSFDNKLRVKLEQAVTSCLNSLPPRAHHSRARHRRAPGAYLQRAP